MQLSVADGCTLEMVSGGNAAVHFSVLSNCLSFPTLVWCPQDADRTRAADFSPPFGNSNVSYFVNLGATDSLTNVVLAGDHKIMVDGVPTTSGSLSLYSSNTVGWTRGLHAGKGNIVFVDGHAEQGGSEVLQSALTRGYTPKQLAIP
jgi:prepilin-type processing-associated H-X9-DG protein